MMLRSQLAAGVQGKTAVVAQPHKSALVAVSAAASRKHAAFKPVRSVRMAAAEPGAEVPAAAPVVARRERKAPTVNTADIKSGQEFEGRVKSVEAYGAFVDIGADKDGLVHISQLASGFIKNAADVVKVGDIVKVRVLNIDATKGRVALTMKGMDGNAEGDAGVVEEVVE